MESHDHQSSADTAMPQASSVASAENMNATAPGAEAASADPAGPAAPDPSPATGQAAQAAPGSTDQATPSATPDQQDQTGSQTPQGQAAGQQQVQPNVIMDPVTGQLYYAMPQGQPVQPPPQNGQFAYYTQAPPEPPPEPSQPDFTQIIKSVEDFAEGDASVADVVKTLWAETSQDDQFWKGAIVGAAAAALFSSETVRGAMGKTFGSIFGKNAADAQASSSPTPDVDPDKK